MRTGTKEKVEGTTERVIQIRRVNKVVKGGKRLAFRATVVVGDMNGSVGLGVGKAGEVPAAIKKAIESAKKEMVNLDIIEDTIPHEIQGKFNSSKVLLKPAPQGTGVIAGGSARTILELAGIKNIIAKSTGARSAINSARATLDGLSSLRDPQKTADLRGKEIHMFQHGSKQVVKFVPAGKSDEKKNAEVEEATEE